MPLFMWVESSIPGVIFSRKRFVLASNSPQRIKLLKLMGLSFDVVPHGVEESLYNKRLPPDVLVQYLASLKAGSVAKGLKDVFIIGADTVVLHNNEVYGKPKDEDDARRMLFLLNNSVHEVFSGLCIKELPSENEYVGVALTKIKMKNVSVYELESYVQSGEPMGKAGAYAVQGAGRRFIDRIDGSYSNVVGLPLELLYKMLNDFVNNEYS